MELVFHGSPETLAGEGFSRASAQRAAAAQKERDVSATFELVFETGLSLSADAPEKLGERLGKFARARHTLRLRHKVSNSVMATKHLRIPASRAGRSVAGVAALRIALAHHGPGDPELKSGSCRRRPLPTCGRPRYRGPARP